MSFPAHEGYAEETLRRRKTTPSLRRGVGCARRRYDKLLWHGFNYVLIKNNIDLCL